MDELRTKELADQLTVSGSVEFWHKERYFVIVNAGGRIGHSITVYVSDEKDEQNIPYARNLIDGFVCSDGAKDTIELCVKKVKNG